MVPKHGNSSFVYQPSRGSINVIELYLKHKACYTQSQTFFALPFMATKCQPFTSVLPLPLIVWRHLRMSLLFISLFCGLIFFSHIYKNVRIFKVGGFWCRTMLSSNTASKMNKSKINNKLNHLLMKKLDIKRHILVLGRSMAASQMHISKIAEKLVCFVKNLITVVTRKTTYPCLLGRSRCRVSDEHARSFSSCDGWCSRIGCRHHFSHHHVANRLGVQVLCGSGYVNLVLKWHPCHFPVMALCFVVLIYLWVFQ